MIPEKFFGLPGITAVSFFASESLGLKFGSESSFIPLTFNPTCVIASRTTMKTKVFIYELTFIDGGDFHTQLKCQNQACPNHQTITLGNPKLHGLSF